MNPNSVGCSKTELDLFCLPPTQVAIDEGSWIEFTPREKSNNIKFEAKASDNYIDLSKSWISFKAQVGGTTAAAKVAGPINLWGHSLFNQIDMQVNDTILTSSSAFYGFEAMTTTLLSYGKEATSTQMELGGYVKDTAEHMDVVALDGDNKGLVTRSKGFNKGEWRDFVMRPCLPLFQQERLLPPETKINLTLKPSDPKFALMFDGDNALYKPIMKDFKLHLRAVKVNSTIAIEHAKRRKDNGEKLYYPIRRLATKAFTLGTGLLSSRETISKGVLPLRVFVMMVEESAAMGAFKKNPFNFQHFNLKEIKLTIGGTTSIPSEPLRPDFTNKMAKDCYMNLFSQTGILFDDKGLDIKYHDFQNGYSIFAFNLTADQSDGDHLELVKRNDLDLHLNFGAVLPSAVTVLSILEYENCLQIDSNDNIIRDYM